MGTNPAVTRPSSESRFYRFYRKASSGGRAPTGSGLSKGALPHCSPPRHWALWAQNPRWPLEGSSSPPFPGAAQKLSIHPVGSDMSTPSPTHAHTGCTDGPIGHFPAASVGPAQVATACWHVLPDSLLQGRHGGTLGQDWAGHRCAGQGRLQTTTPRKMSGCPGRPWHPLAGTEQQVHTAAGPGEVGARRGWACAPRLGGALRAGTPLHLAHRTKA